MEPLSISTGVVSLISGITKITLDIRSFIVQYREAGRDLRRISSELSAVRDILENVGEQLDGSGSGYGVSRGVEEILAGAMRGCVVTVGEIEGLLGKYVDERKRRKIAWAVYAKGDMGRLQSDLEQNKSTLGLALDRLDR